MNRFYALLLGCMWLLQTASAQRITFTKLPANGQLYPRGANAKAPIRVAGRVDTVGYRRLSLLVFRNSTLKRYQLARLQYDSAGHAPFAFTDTIAAELAQYRVKVYLHRDTTGTSDSLLIADRQRIVAGDAYVISGQSNATAYNAPPHYTYRNEYIRTFGINTALDTCSLADTLWSTGNVSGQTVVGTWGMEMARRLLEQYHIPICVINGAAGGAPIQLLNQRTDSLPANIYTNYGRLLYRIDKAGLTGHIRAYFYRQGENETSGWAGGWPMNFDYLFANVRRDYPNLERFYLFQIHILAGTSQQNAVFRDYQRKIQTLQPLIRSHATVGTPAYDGVHFGVEGHQQTGLELFRLVARDLYGAADTVQIASPDIQKVYYSTPARNELVLQFQTDQRMRFRADTTVLDPYGDTVRHQLRQWFFLDQKTDSTLTVRAEGNRIFLTFERPSQAEKLGYLPSNYPQQDSWQPTKPGFAQAFPGPFLKNERGLRAFAFWNVPIAPPLSPISSLTATRDEDKLVVHLRWPSYPAAQYFLLERRKMGDTIYAPLTRLRADAIAYNDSATLFLDSFQYRLRAVTASAEASAEVISVPDCHDAGLVSSSQTGSWNQIQTWRCGAVPSKAALVEIMDHHIINVSRASLAKQVLLKGTLRLRDGARLRIGGS